MAIYSIITICLMSVVVSVFGLEDPDLIRNCGDAKALALGLAPSKNYESIVEEGHAYPSLQAAPVLNVQHYTPNYIQSEKYQSGEHGYSITPGLLNYGNYKSSSSEEGVNYNSVPIAQIYSAPISKTYLPVSAPPSILSYAKPIQTYSKLLLSPALSSHKSQSLQSASSYSSSIGSSLSTIKYVSSPASSLNAVAPILSQVTIPVVSKHSVIPGISSYTSQLSNYEGYQTKENSKSALYNSYSRPVVNTIAQPVVSYQTPGIIYANEKISSNSATHGSASSYASFASEGSSYGKLSSNKILLAPKVATYVNAPAAYVSYDHGYAAGARINSHSLGGAHLAPQYSYIQQESPIAPVKPSYSTFVTPIIKTATGGHKSLKIKSSKYYDAHPNYSFEYRVNDPHTGDNKHQKEERKGDVVNGEYSLMEPDGSIRTVKYQADWETGFHATVTNTKKA